MKMSSSKIRPLFKKPYFLAKSSAKTSALFLPSDKKWTTNSLILVKWKPFGPCAAKFETSLSFIVYDS
uniref:Ribosomal protein L32 n=1 Tax=Romanomermis culicivorax TaxID=13658 RepID=A0A915IDQ8_ROMCU